MIAPYYEAGGITLYHGDCREVLDNIVEPFHLTVASPPYADLVDYGSSPGQIGRMEFDWWRQAMRVVLRKINLGTAPGGRAAINIGDVCLSRKARGRHRVEPLTAALALDAYDAGFDYLTPIRWEKIANASLEASRSSGVLGKPNQPGGIIKNDTETILLLRVPGSYREPTPEQVQLSHIATSDYQRWFRGVWRDVPGEGDPEHPAPFPRKIAARLIRMFSFHGDTVLDPFAGRGTTLLAARALDREAVGIEVEERYCEVIASQLSQGDLFGGAA